MTQWGLDSLFNPAKRHMDEEKRRLQATREEIGDSSGGKRIDLESGKVTIRRAGSKSSDDGDDGDDGDPGDGDGDGDAASAVEARADDVKPEADETEQREVSDPET
jgi:hypothetical protein